MREKKRVLFVVQNAPPFQSGRAKQALRIVELLLEYGVKVDVVSLDYESTLIDTKGVTYRKSIYNAKSKASYCNW